MRLDTAKLQHAWHVVAHHEAGHAVIRVHLLGADSIDAVTIVQKGGKLLGQVVPTPGFDARLLNARSEEDQLQFRAAHVVAAYAGPVAELLLNPADSAPAESLLPIEGRSRHRLRRLAAVGPASDREHAEYFLGLLAPAPGVRGALRTFLRRRTRDLLVGHWPEVEALARALLRHRELTGAQVAGVLRSVPRSRLSRKRWTRKRPTVGPFTEVPG